MEYENIKKDRKRHFDRITLDAKTLERIDAWIEQVKVFKSGVELSRKDILNWLVQSSLPERLSSTQEKELAAKFYSELRFVQYAARRIREALARGEVLTLKELEHGSIMSKEPRVKKNRKVKDKDQSENLVDESFPASSALDSLV